MRALVLAAFDTEPVFADVAMPQVGDHDILVRVQATSVNPVDAMIASGFFRTMQEYRFPAVLGRDFSGVVEATGRAVTRFAQEQSVWGFVKRQHVGNGTFADYVSCPEDQYVAATPAGTTAAEAGVLGLSGVTALECLDFLDLSAGETVLVNGATGGVGSIAVQIAAAAGLRVIATARPGEQSDLVRSWGADEVVDWTSRGFAENVRALATTGVDGVLDLVRHGRSVVAGTDESAGQRQLAALVERVASPHAPVASTTNAANPALLSGRPSLNVHSSPTTDTLGRLGSLVCEGKVRAPITHWYDFDQLPQALQSLQVGSTGKSVVLLATGGADERPSQRAAAVL